MPEHFSRPKQEFLKAPGNTTIRTLKTERSRKARSEWQDDAENSAPFYQEL